MSYVPKYESSFRNSYDEFWEKFNADTPATPQAFRLPLPLALRDLSELKSKHRSRAEGRRRSWGQVGQSAAAAITPHLQSAALQVSPVAQPVTSGVQANAIYAGALLAKGMESLGSPLFLALA